MDVIALFQMRQKYWGNNNVNFNLWFLDICCQHIIEVLKYLEFLKYAFKFLKRVNELISYKLSSN
jgi:hypothetical protein